MWATNTAMTFCNEGILARVLGLVSGVSQRSLLRGQVRRIDKCTSIKDMVESRISVSVVRAVSVSVSVLRVVHTRSCLRLDATRPRTSHSGKRVGTLPHLLSRPPRVPTTRRSRAALSRLGS